MVRPASPTGDTGLHQVHLCELGLLCLSAHGGA